MVCCSKGRVSRPKARRSKFGAGASGLWVILLGQARRTAACVSLTASLSPLGSASTMKWLAVGAGASLDAIVRRTVPAGWFLPVSPGTRQVTVGGAIAADVHGKNHHVDGTFGRYVTRFELLRSDGVCYECTSEQHTDLYRATIGGLGLTALTSSASVPAPRSSDEVDEIPRTSGRQEGAGRCGARRGALGRRRIDGRWIPAQPRERDQREQGDQEHRGCQDLLHCETSLGRGMRGMRSVAIGTARA